MIKLEHDIKTVAKSIIQGNERRKKRIKSKTASVFDNMVVGVIEDALQETCKNIQDNNTRQQMQEKIYKSIVYNTPYEYIADIVCGRRQFYDYRNEFIYAVAKAMQMLPPKSNTDIV